MKADQFVSQVLKARYPIAFLVSCAELEAFKMALGDQFLVLPLLVYVVV